MIKKIEVKTDTEKNSQIEKAIQDEEKPVEKGHKAKEKPLEKMTKPELLQKINELQEESEKNHDLYLRSEAEIENIKKRNKKEKEDWVKYANETLVKEILPVIDNLEMAISHAHNENSLHALREGVELTLKGLRDTLEKSGLEEVKAEGEPFDPSYHHAVSEQEDQNVEAGIILQELQKGYTLNKRLIRPAMVVVSRGKPDNATNHDKVRG
ncbi:MAG: nucleotide exchange factor GrpE [Deltaproteobacteria bacterium]|nr:MAG: nucleotide exchange factor GrpE [Deltaproteobacteria bacterium]